MIGLFPLYEMEEIELILFFKSCVIQKFVHQVYMNSLFYTVKLFGSYKAYHTNRLMPDSHLSQKLLLFASMKAI